jgi:hypothetical protein
MKSLLTLAIFFTSSICLSQTVNILLKDSTTRQVEIIASNEYCFFIKGGEKILFNNLAAIEYFRLSKGDKADQEKLKGMGINVVISDKKDVVKNKPIETLSVTSLDNNKIEILTSNGGAYFQKVIEVNDTTSSEHLYNLAMRWIMLNYKSPNDVIKARLENEEIRGEGFDKYTIKLSEFPSVTGDINYQFTIEVKTGKVRFTIHSMKCFMSPEIYSIETYVLKNDGTFRTNSQATKVIEGATKMAKSLINSFEGNLFNNGKKKDEW